jgi:hypothetical protein
MSDDDGKLRADEFVRVWILTPFWVGVDNMAGKEAAPTPTHKQVRFDEAVVRAVDPAPAPELTMAEETRDATMVEAGPGMRREATVSKGGWTA